MKLAIPSLTVLLSAAAIYGQDALTINTPYVDSTRNENIDESLFHLLTSSPSVVQCQPQLISWTGGTGQYFLAT